MIGGQGLRVGHVERRSQAPRFELGEQRAGVEDLPASGVHEQGTIAQARECSGVEQPDRRRGQREQHDEHIGEAQQRSQLVDPVDARAGATGDADEMDVERGEPLLDGRTDRPVSEDHHGGPGELIGPAPSPVVPALGIAQLRQRPRGGEDRREHPLCDGAVPRPARVAQGHAGRKGGQQAVDAG